MNNLRLPLAALLAPFSLGILLHGEIARATLTLDLNFDTDGIAEVNIAAGVDLARGIAVQRDGKLVLAGFSEQQSVGLDKVAYVTLTRLNGTTGAVDTTFGTEGNGIVTFFPVLAAPVGVGDGRALAIYDNPADQALDQKIIVAGTWRADPASVSTQLFVARFDTAGVLDPGFDTDGVKLITPAGVTDPTVNAVALRSDGSIILVGSGTKAGDIAKPSVGIVVGLTSTGDLDPAYASAVIDNPLTTGEGFRFNDVAILPGDGVLVAGGGGDLTLAQFTSTGVPDTSFSGDGIATFNFLTFGTADGPDSTFDVATALTVLSDGRILLAGRFGSDASSSTSRILGRITSSGALDATFGSGGFAPLPRGNGEIPFGLGVRPSGDIVLAGQGFNPTQVSPNGIAVSVLAGSFTTTLTDLEVLANGDVVASGASTVNGDNANTAFAAVRLAATNLADGPDTVPDPFSFVTKTGLQLGASTTSDTATITGIDVASPISVSGGEYSIGCTSTFTTSAATISSGQTVCVRADASEAGSTASRAQLTIGGVVGFFTLVTGDATPNQFTFVDKTGVAANAEITSASITLTGLTIQTDVVVSSGGSYSVGCTEPFTSQKTRVAPGAQICVRHQSSASLGGVTNTTLTVGAGTEIQDTFTSTTAGDITPDAFTFLPQTNRPKSTVIQSNTVTLTGFTSNSPITVTGGEYSIGCTATFTSTASTVAPNATVCVRHTSSAVGGTKTTTTLTVGAGPDLTPVSAPFTSTTEGSPDTTPAPFDFPDQTNVPLATVITSGAITIGGFDTNAPVSITGGTYSVGCGGQFTASPGTLAPNALVCVRQTSPSTGGTATNTILTVGGVSGTFTSTTLPGDAIPTAFSFTDQTGVDLFATITSAPVTITGIDIASPISVTGGEYSIGCTSTFTSAAANISNGQTVCLRQTSSFDSNTAVDTTLTISTVSDTFTSTTRSGDQTPADFSFTSQASVALDTEVTSDTITITGVDSPVAVRASGPVDFFNQPLFAFSVGCTGTFDGRNGEVVDPGETLCVGVVSAATDSTGVVVTVTIGGSAPSSQKSATFTVTTGETVPDAFTFTDQVGVLLNDTVYADPITITGITAPSKVEISPNSQYQINCTGSFTRNPGVVKNNETICVRQFAAGSLSTLTNTVLTVGGVSDTFTSTTVVDKPLPGGSGMDVWSLLLLGPLVLYRRGRSASRRSYSGFTPWHFLYFLPLPQKQGSLRPSFGVSRR